MGQENTLQEKGTGRGASPRCAHSAVNRCCSCEHFVELFLLNSQILNNNAHEIRL